jgi:hypothetical protein
MVHLITNLPGDIWGSWHVDIFTNKQKQAWRLENKIKQVITNTHNIDHILVLSLNRSYLLTVNVVSTQFGTNMRLKLSITEGDSNRISANQEYSRVPNRLKKGSKSADRPRMDPYLLVIKHWHTLHFQLDKFAVNIGWLTSSQNMNINIY